ncbi:MAG: glycine zipper domain-containing protein [Magnetococcus sp. YQC-5]
MANEYNVATNISSFDTQSSFVIHKKPSQTLLSQSAAVLVSLCLVTSGLTGCAGVNKGIEAMGVSTQEGRIGPNDGSDRCYAQLKTMDALGDFYGEDMIKGALMGAAAGAGIGLLTGHGAEGVLVGAAAGAAVGAAGGYWHSQMQKGRAQAKLAAIQDMNKEMAKYDETKTAAKLLAACRSESLKILKQDYKAKRITAAGFKTQLAAFDRLHQKDLAVWNLIKEQSSKRLNEFDLAAKEYDRAEAAGEPDMPAAAPSGAAGGLGSMMGGMGGGAGGLAGALMSASANNAAAEAAAAKQKQEQAAAAAAKLKAEQEAEAAKLKAEQAKLDAKKASAKNKKQAAQKVAKTTPAAPPKSDVTASVSEVKTKHEDMTKSVENTLVAGIAKEKDTTGQGLDLGVMHYFRQYALFG